MLGDIILKTEAQLFVETGEKSNEFGTKSETLFDDYEVAILSTSIVRITFRHAKIIDYIEVVYEVPSWVNEITFKHGGNGGTHTDTVSLKDDRIISISGDYDADWDGSKNISNLCIKTEKGKTYGPFGYQKGTPFFFEAENRDIIGFFGSIKGPTKEPGIASLGFYYKERKSIDKLVEQLFCALPLIPVSDSSSLWNDYARDIIIYKIKKSCPGKRNEFPYLLNAMIFFPSIFSLYLGIDRQNFYDNYDILPYNFWEDAARTIIACGIMQFSNHHSSLVNRELVENDIYQMNCLLKRTYLDLYIFTLGHHFNEFSDTYKLILDIKEKYLDLYKKQLLSAEYVTAKKKQLIDGTWLHPSWEMFHHWLKLKLLGCNDADLSNIISKLQDAGIVFSDVTFEKMNDYKAYYIDNPITANDFGQELINGINKMKLKIVPNYTLSIPFAYDFLLSEGRKYYVEPHSSCFTGNAKVRMADNRLKNIQDVNVGEKVLSADYKERMVVAKIHTTGKQRNLYTINHMNFHCTGTHPYLNPSRLLESNMQVSKYLCFNRDELARGIIGFETYGITQLKEGEVLFSFQNGGQREIVDIIEVEKTEQYEIPLFDLVVEPDSRNDRSYFIGDDTKQFAVVSEVPIYEDFFSTAIMALRFMSEVKESLIKYCDQKCCKEVYQVMIKELSQWMTESILYAVKSMSVVKGASAYSLQIGNKIIYKYLELLGIGEKSYNITGIDIVMDHFFELLQFQIGNQICDSIIMGYRTFTPQVGMVVAIDIHRIRLNYAGPALLKFTMLQKKEFISAKLASGTFQCHVNDTIYICKNNDTIPSGQICSLEIRWKNSDDFQTFSAKLNLLEASFFSESYLSDGCGQLTGSIIYSVRFLTDEQKVIEHNQKLEWDKASQETYAIRCADLAANKFIQLIRR